MIIYVSICYIIASILMGVILSVRGYMEPIDWIVVFFAPITMPLLIIQYLVRQLKNK
jgi:hypothetical protein